MPYIARHFAKTGLELEVAWTAERELRSDDGQGSWRRKGVSLKGRELVEVVKTERFVEPADFLALLPPELPAEFTVADLAQATGIGRWLAGKMAYSLRHIGAIRQTGKRGNALVYERAGMRKRARKK
jgi:GNAT superfamily N-acetyltransferase